MFIKATGNISPQNTFEKNNFFQEVNSISALQLRCVEPDYKELIDSKMLRRMGRLVRFGVAASALCMKESGIEKPDAITTGTGLGCLEETGIFLGKMIEQNEEMLTPTSFIQSTHNTVSAQVALMLQCNGYNNTFSHKAFSFESALVDAKMLLNNGEAKHVLTGGYDEITDYSFDILQRMKTFRNAPMNNLDLYKTSEDGTIAGEGAAFFLLSNEKHENDYAEILAIDTFSKTEHNEIIENKIKEFLNQNQFSEKNIDLVIWGMNGDKRHDGIYHVLQEKNFAHAANTYYKHLCGEYHTSTAFALWLAAKILKTHHVPGVVRLNNQSSGAIKNILIYNHYKQINHSLMLITAC
jgi:3-oxoacyl-[acyl-carrier-protein] synthase II